MRRAGLAAQLGGDALDVDEGAGVRGVELLGLGVEDERGARVLDQALVSLEVAGIGCQVLVGSELDGVEKDADHDAVVFCDGAFDQAPVTLVQIAHGGDEANAQALGRPLADNLLGLLDSSCNGKHGVCFLSGLLKMRLEIGSTAQPGNRTRC